MKIGVMSDTHLGHVSDLLKKVVEEVFRDTDLILHAGDIVSAEVVNYLEAMGVMAVRGNMDWSDLSSLPTKRVLKAGRFTIGLIHGWGPPSGLKERVRPEFDQIDCLVFGHSHEAFNQMVNGELYFNPGSVSDPRGNRAASVGLLHIGDDIRGEIVTIVQELEMKNLWAPWRMTYILGEDEHAKQKTCIFCVAEGQEKPDKSRLILYVGRLTMIMMNRYPYNNCHMLVAPRRHVPDLSALTAEEMTDLLSKVRDTIDIMRQDAHPDGFNVGLNLGRVAGAGVESHMHFHVVPRWNGDTNFMTVFDDVRVVPEHLEATFDRLAPYFSKLGDGR